MKIWIMVLEENTYSKTADTKARVAFAVLFIGTAVALAFGNPYSMYWPLKCPLFWLTGFQCPFCGMQRATHELFHLHIADAWRLNAGFLLSLPYFMVLAIGLFLPSARKWKFVSVCRRDRTFFFVVGMLMVWGIARNLFAFL